MANKIKNAAGKGLGAAYVTWDTPEGFAKASVEMGKALESSQPLMRTTAAIANRYQNIDVNTSVRDTYSELDYDFFRPNEQVPKHFRDIIAACMGAYQKVPIVKQVIDLMGDFTTQGIRLVHRNPSIERLYNEWFKKIKGHERSERIANCLYRTSNVIIKRADAKLNADVAQEWKSTVAKTDLDHEDSPTPGRYEIPYRYTIINPLIVEVLGEHVAAFTGKVHYVLKLPSTFYNTLSLPLTSFDPTLLTEGMPRDLQQAMDKNEQYLLLDSDKLVMLFYKKDDWDVWAYPMLYSLLDQIVLLKKMERADMTALDGVISHIRVWKLGSMEHKIFPTNAAITKLSNILLNHLAGGAMDLVWGPDLELTQTDTNIAQFLGSEKYEHVMSVIHSGLGVPAAVGRSKGSMSDNFMSIRVLLERLNYGRRVLTEFWEGEIRRVQHAMGFRYPAQVMYDTMNLSDEVAEKALWIQLLDRDIIPMEAVQERFGRIPEIDNILINREYRKRESGDLPPKISPYHDAQPELSLTKIGMQRGLITPSELPDTLDLHLQKPSEAHQDILESQFPPPAPATPSIPAAPKKTGVSGQGRPGGSKDKKKRDKRNPKPSSKAERNSAEFMRLTLYANQLQHAISEVVNPFYLDKFGKSKLSELTADEGVELEKIKFHLLCSSPQNLPAIGVREVIDILDYPEEAHEGAAELYKETADAFRKQKGNDSLTGEEMMVIKSSVYALIKGEFQDD